MATNYVKKINGLAIAASEVAPNSALASTLNTMITGAFEEAPLDTTTGKPNVTNPSTKIIYLTKSSTAGLTDPYTEWIYTSSSTWEIIGETSVDLSQYVNALTSSGSGSYVTDVTKSGKTLTVTKGNLPTASTSTAGIVKLGIASGTAAQGNHTHDISLGTSTGTSSITLNHSGKYQLTAGGKSVIFTMPGPTDVSSKADKVSGATNGNFAGLDSNGNLTDSGKKASDFATSAQGSKADSAIQSVKISGAPSALTPDSNKMVTIPAASTTAAGVVILGTGPSNAAKGNHAHGLSIAKDTSTTAASITLDHGTKYKLTAGGSTYLFATPSATNISGKADKVSGATSGNFAGLDSSGNLTDSGKKASDFATSAQGSKADSAIQKVKVNGTALTIDTSDRSVNVPLAATNSTSGAGTAGAVTLEIVSI